MSSNGSNDNKDRPDDGGVARSEVSTRKRPFKSLVSCVSSTYSSGNNNINGRSESMNRDQINESIPVGLESMVRQYGINSYTRYAEQDGYNTK